MTPSYMQYWGKAKREVNQSGADYHLLAYHSLDVAAVAGELLDARVSMTAGIASYMSLTAEQLKSLLVFIFALHDLGKFSSVFQKLYFNPESDLFKPDCVTEYDSRSFRHDRIGLYFWSELKQSIAPKILELDTLEKGQQGRSFDALMVLVDCALGHHGQPIDTKDVRQMKRFVEPHNVEAAASFFVDVFELLKPHIPVENLHSKVWRLRLEQVSWQIAGLAVLADWIGSDNSHFCYRSDSIDLNEYWIHAQKTAKKALAATDLNAVPVVKPFQSIKAHYGFEPTPLQRWAEQVQLDDSPQLFILEDVTGAGKTEAALALTHRLMQSGAADGFYFGLPTMATSNAMFRRVATHYQQMLSLDGAIPSIVLAHGAREMNALFREAVLASGSTDKNYNANDSTATAQCNEWLADSRKKALLAPVGVGTIDQALLAVLPRRHQSLRLLGLNRKVLIFDEVHAADEYMFELLESLLALHLHQGGSAILLTATLSKKQRQKLVSVWHQSVGLPEIFLQKFDFPLATKVSIDPLNSLLEQPLESRADVTRDVRINFLSSQGSCVEVVLSAVSQGQCVVWVRNSVDDAIAAFRQIQTGMAKPEDCILFHSRFILQDRKAIEEKVLSIFGKEGNGALRAGKVLVATQVFQESLDADADVMISDICPVDDLIQRAGRLHRHTRNSRGVFEQNIKDVRSPPELWVHAPVWEDEPKQDWLSKDFRNTQYVYRSPGRLWLSMKRLRDLGAIRMPGEARDLIEAVYDDAAYEVIPKSLKKLEENLFGEEMAKAAKANASLLKWQEYGYCARSADAWHEDVTDISTRHSDIEMVEVLLLRVGVSGGLFPWVGDERFTVQLSTVKLSKNKYADKLAALPDKYEAELAALTKRYPQIKYMKCWCPELDARFIYSATTGFAENPHECGERER